MPARFSQPWHSTPPLGRPPGQHINRARITSEVSRPDSARVYVSRWASGTCAATAAAALGKSPSDSTTVTSAGALRKTRRRLP